MGRRIEGEAGLAALLAWAEGTCQGFEPVLERGCGGLEVEDLLSLTHTVYLTGLIFIHSLWRVSSDVSRDGETERESWNSERQWKEGSWRDLKAREEDSGRVSVDVKGTVQLGSAKRAGRYSWISGKLLLWIDKAEWGRQHRKRQRGARQWPTWGLKQRRPTGQARERAGYKTRAREGQ